MKHTLIITFSLLIFMGCSNKNNQTDAYGNFEATTTTISAEANGKLLTFSLNEGDQLKANQLVALIDTTRLILQRKKLEASLGTLPKKLRNTLADIAVLQNNKNNAIRERNRLERLVEKKAATTKQLDDANGQIDVINKQIDAIKSNTQTGNAAILAEQEPILAQINIINEQIKNAYLYNPISGTVLTKLAEQHEMVRQGAPLYRIGNLDTLTLKFYVDAVQLQSLVLGQNIEVLTDKGEEKYAAHTGTITWIAEQAEFTPKTIQTKEDRVNLVYGVKAKVPNYGSLKIGMPAEINLSETAEE